MGVHKKRMATAAELPPPAPHYMTVKMRQRALVVARNSKKGLWSRYATGKRESLQTYAGRLRRSEEFKGYGPLEVAYRPTPSGTRYALWIRFKDVASAAFDAQVEADAADLGALGWDGEPDEQDKGLPETADEPPRDPDEWDPDVDAIAEDYEADKDLRG